MALSNTALDVSEIAWFIRMKYGVDVSRYRPTCFRRRVAHRMAMIGCGTVEEYLGYLTADGEEMEKLMDVITIHVTGFYRDRDVFQALEERYVPPMLSGSTIPRTGTIRAWSAGCSTGEEAYSIAIMLERAARASAPGTQIEVFGTDVSEDACRAARSGVYSDERIEGMPSRIRSEYFVRERDGWHARQSLRGLVKFRPHDLFSPAPFSRLDMIFCRNVLIHFEHYVRDAVMKGFHEALVPGGLLVLGKSEVLAGEAERLFDLMDPRCKIYGKRPSDGPSREDRR
ncbi:MAG: protein-glutamate O-methyltransferase CheR [Candidatus Krumholzibacteria bacterium]|nr:protein-glutamate O-methyltransferase CheR [Candidatus Krumholzibacteria bacterium]